MEATLLKIDSIIEHYNSGAWVNVDNLRTLLRELSVCHYHLTSVNIEAYNNWNALIHNRKQGTSVASAKVIADAQVPELRMTRKILESVKNVVYSMQQELSIIKRD